MDCGLHAHVGGAEPIAAGRRVLKEERNYILQMIKKIRASGANVLLIQKSILRDAVTDLSLHYLVGLWRHVVMPVKGLQVTTLELVSRDRVVAISRQLLMATTAC